MGWPTRHAQACFFTGGTYLAAVAGFICKALNGPALSTGICAADFAVNLWDKRHRNATPELRPFTTTLRDQTGMLQHPYYYTNYYEGLYLRR